MKAPDSDPNPELTVTLIREIGIPARIGHASFGEQLEEK